MIDERGYQPKLIVEGHPYNNSWQNVTKTLTLDARGDNAYMVLEEYNRETNRTHTVSMQFTREEWERFMAINSTQWGKL